MEEQKAENNRTLTLLPQEISEFKSRLLTEKNITRDTSIINRTLNGDILTMIKFVPDEWDKKLGDLIKLPNLKDKNT